MTIDKVDPPLFEQAKSSPEVEGIEDVRGFVKLSLYAGKLAEQEPDVKKVCTASEIKEERTFSKEAISKLIALFAMEQKLELDKLKVTKIINDEQGRLLVLEVQSPNPDGGYQLINYTIKGRHDRNQSQTTSLDRTFWDKDDMPEGGDIIAEYLEEKWRFTS